MSNEYLKYTSKDYNSIYTDLIDAIPSITDLWTNTEDGDPGIVLVKLMSALGDMLSYNMDKQALEYYSSTVTQRKNAAKLFNLIGYKMHWYRSATNQIALTNTQIVPNKYMCVYTYRKYLLEKQETAKQELKEQYEEYCRQFLQQYKQPPENYPEYYTWEDPNNPLPNYTYILTNSQSDAYAGYAWIEQHTLYLYTYIAGSTKTLDLNSRGRSTIPYIIKPTIEPSADSSEEYLSPTDSIEPGETHNFDIIQGNLHSIRFNSSKLRDNRYYFTESAVDENNIWLSYSSTQDLNRPTTQTFIDKTENLLTVTDDNIYFEFGIDDFDIPYIELSSYWVNKLENSVDFILYYVRTSGVYGNITKNYLTDLEGLPSNTYSITHPSNNTAYINDLGELIATPGYHPQTAHQAYIDSLNYVTTFNTLVTIYDFERFCKRQEGISNTFAVDKQRANDINTALLENCNNLTLSQLLNYYMEARDSSLGPNPSLEELRTFYMEHKSVQYNEWNPQQDYKSYMLNLHIVCGNFDLALEYTDDGLPKESDRIAFMSNPFNHFWLYQIISDYEVNSESRRGRIAKYLDEKFRNLKIVNVLPEYAAVRVFPWRCCGTIYLKNPVTESVADQILKTVLEHLAFAFHPRNIEFGKKINYMDVINVIMDSHEMIRYFDAGLGSRKLIDIDESVDISYFNDTSLMYYVQSPEGFSVDNYYFEGNNCAYRYGSTDVTNPYYKMLFISPEYIIK